MQWHLQLLTAWPCSPGESHKKSGPVAITASEITVELLEKLFPMLESQGTASSLHNNPLSLCSNENLGLHVF